MPVLGHGLVGLATALVTTGMPRRPLARGLWLPIIVSLAYLPDIAAQVGMLVGAHDAASVTHSIAFAVAVSLPAAWILARVARVSFGRCVGIALGTVLLHVLMDVLQGTNRMLWWPVSIRAFRVDRPLLPPSGSGEALLFGVAFCLFVALRHARRRYRGKSAESHAAVNATDQHFTRLGVALTVPILLLAAGMHMLRAKRSADFDDARAKLVRGDHAGALDAFGRAERWPGAGKPGRIAYGRAEVYVAMGDAVRAEDHYRASLRVDPDYFWAIADLAALYASSGGTMEARRARVAPLLQRLGAEFGDHPRYAHVVARIRRKLNAPRATLQSDAADVRLGP